MAKTTLLEEHCKFFDCKKPALSFITFIKIQTQIKMEISETVITLWPPPHLTYLRVTHCGALAHMPTQVVLPRELHLHDSHFYKKPYFYHYYLPCKVPICKNFQNYDFFFLFISVTFMYQKMEKNSKDPDIVAN